MLKVLVTGVDGFTGRYLALELRRAGFEVVGLFNMDPVSPVDGVTEHWLCDLCDPRRLADIIGRVQPDAVVHLAAISFVAHGDVDAIYRTNVIGTRNLLESLVRSNCQPIVLLASSANVYGNAVAEVIDESTQMAPANDYAVSKLAMEYMARLYSERLRLVMVRPFNYTGVGQSESFLLPKIVAHVRRRAPVIELGNLDVGRDFSDVRTVVQYYRRLLECEAAVGQTFNVCSGRAYTMMQVLDMVRELSGHDFDVRVNPAFVRTNEIKVLRGSHERLVAAIGQIPDIPLKETLRWMLEV